MQYYYWIIIGLILSALEIATPGFVILWFGIGAIIVGLLDLIGLHNLYVQISIFVILSIILVILSRTLYKDVFFKKSPGNLQHSFTDNLVGKTGVVTIDINNELSDGRVLIMGQDWSARSEDNTIITKDTKVIINKVDSAKLIVSKTN